MRTLIIGLLQIVAVVGFILMIAIGGYVGYIYEQYAAAQNIAGIAIDPTIGAVIGALFGLVAAVITFGVVPYALTQLLNSPETVRTLLAQLKRAEASGRAPRNRFFVWFE